MSGSSQQNFAKNQSSKSFLDRYFLISERGSNIRTEVIAGLTTFLAMVYSIVVVPGMLGSVGFPKDSVFIAACLVAGFGSILMGLWAKLPMAIGCAISLTAFTAFSLVAGPQKMPIPIALGAVFLMGLVFTLISVTGIRAWILRNLPISIAHGAGIGIGLFLLIIAASNSDVGIIIKNQYSDLPVAFGDFTSFSVMASLIGLVLIIALERMKVPGGILLVIIGISVIGLIFDPKVTYSGIAKLPSMGEQSLFFGLDIMGALNIAVLPVVFALVMTAIFDATGTIRAVAGQANLLDKDNQIINGGKALTADSVSSIFSGLVGAAPAAVYIESATGTAAGGKTGLTAVVVGLLFCAMLFFAPLAGLVPMYATAPALMYVGLLMLSNVRHLDFDDFVGAMSGLICAVFIVLTCNIVTGIMLGFASLVIGRICSGEAKKLNVGTVIIAVILVAFYALGYAI